MPRRAAPVVIGTLRLGGEWEHQAARPGPAVAERALRRWQATRDGRGGPPRPISLGAGQTAAGVMIPAPALEGPPGSAVGRPGRPLALVVGASRRTGPGAAIATTPAHSGRDVGVTYWLPYDAAQDSSADPGGPEAIITSYS